MQKINSGSAVLRGRNTSMTNLKLSSKMHVMIIVSVLIIAIGLAMGLVFQFVMNGY